MVLFGSVRTVCAQAFRRTPDQIMGPFYPVVKPLDQDADLTTIAGKKDEFVGKLQQHYGYKKDQAERELDNFLRSLDRP